MFPGTASRITPATSPFASCSSRSAKSLNGTTPVVFSEAVSRFYNEFKSKFISHEEFLKNFDIIINATSLGLNKESINLDFSKFGRDKLFYDVIYNPKETNFLKAGKKLGNKIENGKLMFIYQAFEAFRLWHGVEPNMSKKILKLLDHD